MRTIFVTGGAGFIGANLVRHLVRKYPEDRIVVLDEGAVVGTGSHQELMATNETYREIVLSQLTEAEASR